MRLVEGVGAYERQLPVGCVGDCAVSMTGFAMLQDASSTCEYVAVQELCSAMAHACLALTTSWRWVVQGL